MTTRWEKTAVHDDGELVGAQWWRTAIEEEGDGTSRRSALLSLAGLAAAGLTVGGAIGSSGCSVLSCGPEEVVLDNKSIELQKQFGWDVGASGGALVVPEGFIAGAAVDPMALEGLVERLAPTNPTHAPYYLPVLLQSLTALPTSPEGSPGAQLRDLIRPLTSPAIEEALGRGRGLASLFDAAPPGRAIVVDLPGPEAIAMATGLADRFDPVFILDNWPHPLGVVPSHLTLGALLQMLPELELAAAARPTKAMPVFVLDSNRLAPFDETGERFDNRYVAALPSAEKLKELGITDILYVRPTATDQELDDLNADLVDWDRAGIKTQLVHADAFRAPVEGETPPAVDPNAKPHVASPDDPYYSARTHDSSYHHHYYGGSSSHWFFWAAYGFGMSRFLSSSPGFSAPSFRPIPRSTMFSSPMGVRSSPSGFGQSSVRTRAGSSPSLSSRTSTGTFGRSSGGRSGA